MKQYTFELVIPEGNDEFWESIKSDGCKEVEEMLRDILGQIGYYTKGEYQNCNLILKKFKDSKKFKLKN